MSETPIIEVEGLRAAFKTRDGDREVLHGIGFDLQPGEMLGLVGSSGSGKTTTLRAILGHLPRGARITGGSIRYRGSELVGLKASQLRKVRGSAISTIVQDPINALSPVATVGEQMQAIAADHGIKLSREQVEAHLSAVGIADPGRVAGGYPYELSGGMAQRVIIAIAVSMDPAVIVADEPTSALDVTIQAQIMELLQQMVAERDLAILFVTHDIALVSEYCRRVVVMRSGEVVEQGLTSEVLYAPQHEYTRELVAASRPSNARAVVAAKEVSR
jgi:ABC-type dipeptide/oligopeptide/nickel transport system ATPase component